MKIKELFENENNGSLIGLRIKGKLITDKTKDEYWTNEFYCFARNLTSLEGAPNKINGHFNCRNNENLTSLKGCPQEGVEGFYCNDCNLTSLENAPNKIDGQFSCTGNKNLISLEGAPKKINGSFNCSNNKKLTSLKGCTQEGVESFYCHFCNLTSLIGVPKKINGNFWGIGNPIKTIKGIHQIFEYINGELAVPDSVESNILGVLKIKNLKKFYFSNDISSYVKSDISEIVNKYLPNPSPSDIIDCQNELIDAGYEEYAEL